MAKRKHAEDVTDAMDNAFVQLGRFLLLALLALQVLRFFTVELRSRWARWVR